MKIAVTRPTEINVSAITILAPVRYADEDMPYDFPFRVNDTWKVTVDIATGAIRDWPQGWTGDLYMKVTDEGTYRLLGGDGEVVAEIVENYVPPCIPGEWGDYLQFVIDKNGVVDRWKEFCDAQNIRDSFFPSEGV